MTLLELLVQELPKHGGWPEGAESSTAHEGENYAWFFDSTNWPLQSYPAIKTRLLSELGVNVTREQYEAALAASKQPEWDGEGLPPVGCECEVINPGYKNKRFDRFIGEKVTVIAHDLIGPDPVAVFRMPVNGDDYEQDYHAMIAGCFRPIRTEAERKRDDVVDSIVEHYIGYHGDPKGGEAYIDRARAIYSAIAAGKIPGIKLAD